MRKLHHRAKLTFDQVQMIRKRHVPMCRINGAAAIARELGVSSGAVHNVVHGRFWKDVPDEK